MEMVGYWRSFCQCVTYWFQRCPQVGPTRGSGWVKIFVNFGVLCRIENSRNVFVCWKIYPLRCSNLCMLTHPCNPFHNVSFCSTLYFWNINLRTRRMLIVYLETQRSFGIIMSWSSNRPVGSETWPSFSARDFDPQSRSD